jgi:amino acid transporter
MPETEFRKALGLFDSVMIVAGIMVGSGIFIVSAEISRQVGSAGWLLVTWVITGVLTVFGALSYGELAAMMPSAGGMYVYLREAFSPLLGFLYGWTLLTVIQTGTIAAVAIAFARFSGVMFPLHQRDALPRRPHPHPSRLCRLALDHAVPCTSHHPRRLRSSTSAACAGASSSRTSSPSPSSSV